MDTPNLLSNLVKTIVINSIFTVLFIYISRSSLKRPIGEYFIASSLLLASCIPAMLIGGLIGLIPANVVGFYSNTIMNYFCGELKSSDNLD